MRFPIRQPNAKGKADTWPPRMGSVVGREDGTPRRQSDHRHVPRLTRSRLVQLTPRDVQ
ncbi:hypothetical protein RB5138 [Rhodopirellula baltica SH 1]|uniref:Uncharacterized protein n=1 Tax=Rhodopirellula baltica (strain DSM 10527 / NCIMB 13988 / SH1) TaxID=243090 RepID=Q7UGM0_RHOBA|nr:hypothetical protein RB5138 [Rhodopirellula baltica SH 1]